MNFGVIFNESFDDYLSADAVGSHKLADLRPRPIVYQKKHVLRTMPQRHDTPAFLFGRLFHCLALEGEAATAERFAVIPTDAPEDLRRFRNAKKPSPATVESIAWWDAFDKANAGKSIVEQSAIDLAWKMVGAIRAKPSAVALLARGKPEVTFRCQLPHFAAQARVDWFDGEASAGPLIINLKSIDSLDDFDKQFETFEYYKGDAFYRLVVGKVLKVEPITVQCINLVVEKNEPFECAVRSPDAESLAIGAREVMSDLHLLSTCYERNVWPGEPDEVRPVSLSEWKIRKSLEAA